MRDIEQYYKYPSLQWLFTTLEEEGDRRGLRRASAYVDFLCRDIKRIKKCNLDKETKSRLALMIRREYVRRLGDIVTLNDKKKSNLKAYVIARTREMIKKYTYGGKND